MDSPGRRPGPAGHAPELGSGRPVRPAAAPLRRAVAAGARFSESGLLAALPRLAGAEGSLSVPLCRPPGPRPGRQLAGGRRQKPRPHRRRLCHRKPDRDFADAARGVSRLPGRAAGAVLPHDARHAARAGHRSRHAPHRAAQPRPDQPHLFRGRLPRPLPRLCPGRRRRPDDSRQPGVPEDAGRPVARECHSAPRPRRGLRLARAARRLDSTACPA